MTTITLDPRVGSGTPVLGPSPATRSSVPAAHHASLAIRKRIALDRANVVRIRNGRGTRVRAVSGVLWVTEEYSLADHILLPGDAIELAQRGTAILLAHRPARIVLEVPAGVRPPDDVEAALADGEPGTRIALGRPGPVGLVGVAGQLAAIVREAWMSARTRAAAVATRWKAAETSDAEALTRMAYSDGFPPRHLRRRAWREARDVERAIVDESITWRT